MTTIHSSLLVIGFVRAESMEPRERVDATILMITHDVDVEAFT